MVADKTVVKQAMELVQAEANGQYIMKEGRSSSHHPHAEWDWDSLSQLIHDLDTSQKPPFITFRIRLEHEERSWDQPLEVSVNSYREGFTAISVTSEDVLLASRLHAQLKTAVEHAIPISKPERVEEQMVPKIFIGHGRSPLWRELKDHLQDMHHFQTRVFESGARAGHTIRDILNAELDHNNFAFIIMTAEDEQDDGEMRARQNVVHEAGLFQGKLGFEKAVILIESGVEGFSNVDGIQYIPFSKDNIREAFGDAVATVKAAFNL